MKRILLLLAGAAALLLAAPSAAHADQAQVTVLHAIPGQAVDVVVGGKVVIPNFQPGQTQDLSALAGKTLEGVEVRKAGTSTVVIGPVAKLAVPASGNWTLVAHLDAAGKPVLTPFQNDTSAVPAGQGRLILRHTAAAPPVDVVLGTARPVTNLANGKEAVLVVPAGTISGAKIALAGGAPVADVPPVDVKAGTVTIAYAAGSPADNSLTFYTQSVAASGGTPTKVGTGNSLPASSTPAPWLVAGAAALALAGTAALVLRRRLA